VADKMRDILTDNGTVTLKYYVIQESTRWTGNSTGRRILDQATGRVTEDYIGVDTSSLRSPAALVIVTLLALLPSDKVRQPEVRDIMREIAALLDKLDAGNDTLVSDITPSLLTIEVGKANNFKSWTEAVNAILENMARVSFNSREINEAPGAHAHIPRLVMRLPEG